MLDMRVLIANGFYPAYLLKNFNISLDEWELIKMAPDRDWLANGVAKRNDDSIFHRALRGYDAIKSLELQIVSN